MVNLGARLVALVTVLLAFGCVALVVALMLVLGCLATKVIFLAVGAALCAGVRLLVARLVALALRLGVGLVVAFGCAACFVKSAVLTQPRTLPC